MARHKFNKNWFLLNFILTLIFIGSCSFDLARDIKGSPKQGEMQRLEESIYELIAEIDPVRKPYIRYDEEVKRIDRDIAEWEAKRDAIPMGRVIGKMGFVGTLITGKAAVISDALEGLRNERDSSLLPLMRRRIARDRGHLITSWIETGTEGDSLRAQELWNQRQVISDELFHSKVNPHDVTISFLLKFLISDSLLLYFLLGCPIPIRYVSRLEALILVLNSKITMSRTFKSYARSLLRNNKPLIDVGIRQEGEHG